ncbi:hypothetical protein OIDMADRAFT_60745 [Oidiodendron maius Zn]|uniref:Apple domain-containing protein n=1 Tax=Oidiodendron maius (strain Zn) TaxID=913774 RepID=A0A0C3C6A0_OIDMZ|nr:hypothetical protein OIDMADRAFT_60745 [Oidiodendron maius Zn]
MHSYTSTILLASGLLSLASAVPLQVRSTCGSVPAGTGAQTPLSQPTGITTANACQASCEATNSCLSFVFGMVNNDVECMLFSVAAANVPAQSSQDLIVFDKACTDVPKVVPTTSNPTGANTGSTSGTGATGSTPGTGATTPKPATNAGSGSTNNGAKPAGHKLAVRSQCGGAPTGPSNNKVSPISTPANVNTMAACQAACKKNTSCKSFEFGTAAANGAKVCHMFSVAAAQVPAPAQGQSFVVYDAACSA